MNTASTLSALSSTLRPVLVATVLALACTASAHAAELKLLSQGLPKASYTQGDSPAGKDSGAEKAFDGDLTTAWCNGPNFPAWLMVDLGADCNVIKVMTFLDKSEVWYAYKIEVSDDKQTWTTFVDQTQNKDASEDPAYTDMGGVIGRYVRITLTDAPERNHNPPWFWPVIKEFQVYGLPIPKPAAAATAAASTPAK